MLQVFHRDPAGTLADEQQQVLLNLILLLHVLIQNYLNAEISFLFHFGFVFVAEVFVYAMLLEKFGDLVQAVFTFQEFIDFVYLLTGVKCAFENSVLR